MYKMEKIVPLIGPMVTGPLGVMHLPRMWYKGVLSAAGLLPDVYFDNYKGFNQRVCDAIGLDPEPWFAFLKTMPTYAQAETYVKDHATKLTPAAVAELNTLIATFPRPEENAAGVRARVGLDDPSYNISANLIDVDDWHSIHEELIAHKDDKPEPLIPMVSSAESGPAGIAHLPRLWMKALLNAVGALHPEWKTGNVCGFDNRLAKTIGLDIDETSAYIKAELPDYLTFEKWVLGKIPTPDAASKAEWTKGFMAMEKPVEMGAAERAECGIADDSVTGTIVLNDLVDWKYMHDYVTSQRAAAV
jgi:hypothetical protein